jgi:hypothetical protein
MTFKEKVARLENQLKQKTDFSDIQAENLLKLQKERKHLMLERDKNKARIQKLIQRKGKFDSGVKTCKNCNQEFQEKENFNWSCKLH